MAQEKPTWWERLTGSYDPFADRRELLAEGEFLKLRNEIVKERFVRLIQGWFVLFLAIITIAAILLMMGVRPKFLQSAPDPAALALVEEAQRRFDASQTPENVAKLNAAKAALASTSDEKVTSENAGWARTTLTAIIGFITGFIAARRIGPASEGSGTPTDTPLPSGAPQSPAASPGAAPSPPDGENDVDPKDLEDPEDPEEKP